MAARRQRGVAVLSAMLVVTLATIIAVNLMWRASLDQRRTAASLNADQGYMFLQGAEAWAGDILREDLQVSGPDSDHLGEIWAFELPPVPVDGGFILGRLTDLQGRFNINNLVTDQGSGDPVARAQLERLLRNLELDPGLAGALVDWIDADAEPNFPAGGEDGEYTGADPAYRTPNVPITTTTELMAINGFDRDVYAVLAPHITALPGGTPLNVNTAGPYVLSSLSDEIDLPRAEALIEERGEANFVSVQDSFAPLLEEDVLQRIDAVSRYFQLSATISIGTSQYSMYSLLQRDDSGLVRAVFRSLGTE